VESAERWASGEAYEPFIGRWSRLVASRFVSWLSPRPKGRWLDIGCGTGALTHAILVEGDPQTVRGIDPSHAFIDHARTRFQDPRVQFEVGNALAISESDDAIDYAVSGLVINFVPQPEIAVEEMARIACPGGCVASYVWDYADGMQMLRHFWNAAREVDPTAAELDEGVRFPLCHPRALEELWLKGGLQDIGVVPIEVPTVFSNFDDYWLPFLGGQGPAPTYTSSLDEDERQRLGESLRARLPADGEGKIALTARAWAISGRTG
jgi:SAM-dependent methyltransferase